MKETLSSHECGLCFESINKSKGVYYEYLNVEKFNRIDFQMVPYGCMDITIQGTMESTDEESLFELSWTDITRHFEINTLKLDSTNTDSIIRDKSNITEMFSYLRFKIVVLETNVDYSCYYKGYE